MVGPTDKPRADSKHDNRLHSSSHITVLKVTNTSGVPSKPAIWLLHNWVYLTVKLLLLLEYYNPLFFFVLFFLAKKPRMGSWFWLCNLCSKMGSHSNRRTDIPHSLQHQFAVYKGAGTPDSTEHSGARPRKGPGIPVSREELACRFPPPIGILPQFRKGQGKERSPQFPPVIANPVLLFIFITLHA